MNISYNIEKLKEIIDDLCLLTGLAVAAVDTGYRYIYINKSQNDSFCSLIQSTVVGSSECGSCDNLMLKRAGEEKCAFSHVCHAGLRDTTVPIMKNGVVVGYILIGRVRESDALSPELTDTLLGYGLEREMIAAAYRSVERLSDEKLSALLRLVTHILLENAIEIDHGSLISRATEYIDENISGDLSLPKLSSELFTSKNQLYAAFRDTYGKTVGDYITDRRIKKAKSLFAEGYSVCETAAAVGISNLGYFSRLFKKRTEMTPAAYKRLLKK